MKPTIPIGPDRTPRSAPAPELLGASLVVTAGAARVGPASSAIVPGPARAAEEEPVRPGAPSGAATAEGLPPFVLRAYRISEAGWGAGWELRPAPARRPWMDEHTHAYHCLPLVVANQWGWEVTCPADVRARWDGSPEPSGLVVAVEPPFEAAVKSQFGRGILTFSPPWLFRTPPGWDLFAKGPANRWKGNCVPLEGIIETWWLPYTFTFNWKLVEPGEVSFAKGEVLGQLVPVPHRTFAEAVAVEEPLSAAPDLAAEMDAWRVERERRAGLRHPNHLMYRKARDIDGHLVRVPVPAVGPAPARGTAAGGGEAGRRFDAPAAGG